MVWAPGQLPELKSRRAGIPGGADWTHQYADAGNSGTSTDTALSLPLSLLWYGEPGINTQQERHLMSPAPLVSKGRVYLQCETVVSGRNLSLNTTYLLCFDAYNGVEYWRTEVPGARRRVLRYGESNLALHQGNLFVAAGTKCFLLDGKSGEITTSYSAPVAADGTERLWSCVAVEDGVLVGSTTKAHTMSFTPTLDSFFSDAVFAYDLKTRKPLWTKRGINIKKNTVAASDGMVFAAEAGVISKERAVFFRRERPLAKGEVERKGNPVQQAKRIPALYTICGLDLRTGTEKWRREMDLTYCGGAEMIAIACRGVFLLGGGYYNHEHFAKSHARGAFTYRRMVALDSKDGSILWDKKTNHNLRPLIVGDTIVAVPFSFDLKTGEQRMKTVTTRGTTSMVPWKCTMSGCGILTGSPVALFGRMGSSGYLEHLSENATITVLPGARPGCWANMIPAGGVVVQTEASTGCVCRNPVQCTMVFFPAQR